MRTAKLYTRVTGFISKGTTEMAGLPKEVEALGQVLAALHGLDAGQREWVIASTMTNLGLSPLQPRPAVPNLPGGGTPSGTGTGGASPKEFLRLKNPQTDVQRIACLAYYLTHERQQPHFKTKDITALNTEAAGTKLSNPSFAVGNATKQSQYLAPAGSGKKQITALGEDMVNALPDQDAVRMVGQGRHKKKARKKAASQRARSREK